MIKNLTIYEEPEGWFVELTIFVTREEFMERSEETLRRLQGRDRKEYRKLHEQCKNTVRDSDNYYNEGPFRSREHAELFVGKVRLLSNGCDQQDFCKAVGESLIPADEMAETRERFRKWIVGDPLPSLGATSEARLRISKKRIQERFERNLVAIQETGAKVQ